MNAAARPASDTRRYWLIVPLLSLGFLASAAILVAIVVGLGRLALWVLEVTA